MNRILMSALTAAVLLAAESGYSVFEKGLAKERADADFRGAITFYEQVVREHARDRKLAAQALVRMGQCYDKLGDAESRKAYERVVREFGDQKESVAAARARLAAMAKPANPSGISVRLVFEGLPGDAAAVSPDGRLMIHYEDRTQSNLVVRDLVTGQSRQVTAYGKYDDGPEYDPLFSPDSRQIAYDVWREGNKYELHVVGAYGSGDRTIWKTDSGDYIELKGWFPDGSRLLTLISQKAGPKRLQSVSIADGSVKVLKEGGGLEGGWLSPDGKYFAYAKRDPPDRPDTDIWCLSLEDSSETPLVAHPANDNTPRWTPDGKGIIFVSDRRDTNGLWYLPVSAGKPAGVPELIRDIGPHVWPIGLTRDGTLYYQTRVARTDAFLAEFDPASGKIVSAPSEIAPKFLGHTQNPAFSADGQWLAYFRKTSTNSPGFVLVLRSLVAGKEREVATRWANVNAQRWFPDGQSLLILGTDPNGYGYHRFNIATGKSTLLKNGDDGTGGVFTIVPDGKTIYFQRKRLTGTHHTLYSWNIETGEEHELLRSDNRAVGTAVSPDGQRLVVIRGDGDDNLIEILSLRGGDRREIYRAPRLSDAARMGFPNWSPGDEIFFIRGSAKEGSFDLWRIPAQGGTPAKTEVQLQPMWRGLTYHPDGRRFAFDAGVDRFETWALESFLPKAAK